MQLKRNLFLLAICSLFFSESEAVCTDPSNEWTGTTGNQRWNNLGNWSICIPGTTISNADIANFSTQGSGIISLDAAGGDLAISPGLNSLTFNNATGFTINSSGTTNHIQFNLSGSIHPSIEVLQGSQVLNAVTTINATTLNISVAENCLLTILQNMNNNGTGSVIFTGPGELKIAPTVAARGIIIAGSFTQESGTVQNVNTLAVASGTGSRLSAPPGIFLNGGSFVTSNSGPISGTGVGASNEATSSQMIVSSSNVSMLNTGNINSTSGRGCQFLIGTTGLIVNEGTFTASNTGTILNGVSIGCQVLSGGSITLNESTITTSNSGAITSSSTPRGCNIQAGGTGLVMTNITFSQSNTGTINGNNVIGCSLTSSDKTVLNSGSLTSINSGIITAGAGVRIFGNTTLTVNNGTVAASNSGTINSTTSFGSALVSNSNITINGGSVTCTNTGTVNAGIGSQLRGVATFIQTGGSLLLSNSGPIISGTGSIGAQANSVNIQITGGTITLSNSGMVSGTATSSAGSQLVASSNLTMSGGTINVGANTGSASGTNNFGSVIAVSGAFTLNGGSLINDDKVQTPTLTIGNLANVAGRGSFSNISNAQTTQITNSGIVTPGSIGIGSSTPGTMNINGAYTQSSSGKLVVNILDPSTYSKLNVLGTSSGNAQLNGNLEIAAPSSASFAPGDVFTIVQTEKTNGLSGAFANIINDVADLIPHLQYFSDHVDLSFTPTTTSISSTSGATQALIASVNQINVSLGKQMVRLSNRLRDKPMQANEVSFKQDPDSLNELLADNNDTMRFIRKKELAYASPECLGQTPWEFYVGPTAIAGRIFANEDQTAFNYWSAGVATGFDYAFSQVGLGTRIDYDHFASNTCSWGRYLLDEVHGSFYATYMPRGAPNFAFNGSMGGAYQAYRLHRSVQMLSHQALGKPKGGEFDVLFETDYIISHRQFESMPRNLQIIPLANVQYVHLHIGSYKEHNAGTFALEMKSQNIQSLRSTLGSRLNYTWCKTRKGHLPLAFTMDFNLAWQREYLNKKRSTEFTPVAFNQPFSSLVVPASGRNILLTGIDLLWTFDGKNGLEVSYDFEWNPGSYLNNNFYLGFNRNF